MNSIEDMRQRSLMGSPIFLEDICAIFPPTLKDITNQGYEEYLKCVQLMQLNKPTKLESADEDSEAAAIFKSLSDYQYFLMLCNLDRSMQEQANKSFSFFCRENVIFSLEQEKIIVGPPEEKRFISGEKFDDFRSIIKIINYIDIGDQDLTSSSKDSPEVRALKEKMRENRKKVAAAKNKKKSGNSAEAPPQFSDLISSFCINDCGVNIINVWDLTYYAFHDQLTRMGWRDSFNINNRAALAGAKIKKEDLQHWIHSMSV